MIFSKTNVLEIMPLANNYLTYIEKKYKDIKWIYYTESTIYFDCYTLSIFVSSKGDVLLQNKFNHHFEYDEYDDDDDEDDDKPMCKFYERRFDIPEVELKEDDYKEINVRKLSLQRIQQILNIIDNFIRKRSEL